MKRLMIFAMLLCAVTARAQMNVTIALDTPHTVDATPTFSPAAGTYSSTQTVTISTTTPGAYLLYCQDTINTCTPTTLYSAPVSVSSTGYLRAIACEAGALCSAVGSAAYTISSLGLVFNMPLNEGGAATTAIDSVSGNNGTWSGTKSCSGSYYINLPPNVGCFDGSTNYITLTSNTGLNLTTNFSVVAWVYYTGTPTAGVFPRIFSNLTAAATNGYELLLHDTSGLVPNRLYFQG